MTFRALSLRQNECRGCEIRSEKMEKLSTRAHVIHTTGKQLIARRSFGREQLRNVQNEKTFVLGNHKFGF